MKIFIELNKNDEFYSVFLDNQKDEKIMNDDYGMMKEVLFSGETTRV